MRSKATHSGGGPACRGRTREGDRRWRPRCPRRDDVSEDAVPGAPRRRPPQTHAPGAPGLSGGQLQPGAASHPSRCGRRLRDHGADRVPADVGDEHHLHRHRAHRDRHGAGGRAGDRTHPGDPGGAHPGAGKRRGRQGDPGDSRERARLPAHLGAKIEVPTFGEVEVDVCWGGMFYAIADAARFGLRIAPEHGRELARVGAMVKQAAREQLEAVHPENPEIRQASIGQLTGPFDPETRTAANAVSVATWTGALDRSPCGTGTSARMAALHARGLLGIGEDFHHFGPVGTEFVGRLIRTTTVGGVPAVVPTISGTAWITGIAQYSGGSIGSLPGGLHGRGYLVGVGGAVGLARCTPHVRVEGETFVGLGRSIPAGGRRSKPSSRSCPVGWTGVISAGFALPRDAGRRPALQLLLPLATRVSRRCWDAVRV
ncbi:4-hydroxyproline 2-epimerase 1 [Geodia barretti]|uniref:4-hydroxyproline 2-epimerase 1 n=1 Tax=Geodia barretti TaxID=519541 RepID=A0AA35RBG8_GEOBA|nr:4-hydroxyproline 2-epimerase 1 [Geodia barretti]